MVLMFVFTLIAFLLPGGLLLAACRKFRRAKAGLEIPVWRSRAGALALALATAATVFELIFFLSWFHNGGSPHGMMPSPGIWKFIGRVAGCAFLGSIALAPFGKGMWRLTFVGWVLSLCLIVPLIFAAEMD
jgi:hypothetical protein